MALSSLSRSRKIFLRATTARLTDYPVSSETYGRKIAIVGVATRGCLIANSLSLQSRQLSNFIYVTCDPGDVASINSGKKIIFDVSGKFERDPFRLRGLVFPELFKVRQALQGVQVTFILVGLGGCVGSGIAPLVAACAKELHSMTVAIVSMPYNFEKHKFFYAGCALRQLRESCDGIMLIGNETVFEHKLPLFDAYARLNEEISLALNAMLEPVERDGTSSGVENVVDFIRANPYTILRPALGERTYRDGGEHFENSDENLSILKSFRSLDDATGVIDSYDPVDVGLKSRRGNLDQDMDGLGAFSRSALPNLEVE